MKLDRVYIRSGDDGRTSLGDGARPPKFHVRVAAYGSVDEANSVIGIALLHVSDAAIGRSGRASAGEEMNTLNVRARLGAPAHSPCGRSSSLIQPRPQPFRDRGPQHVR
jgi:Cobalamin adenosyltransferase